MIDKNDIVNALKVERDRISIAISALEGVSEVVKRRGIGRASGNGRRRRKGRTMSAAARKRISEAAKARWAKAKKAGKNKL